MGLYECCTLYSVRRSKHLPFTVNWNKVDFTVKEDLRKGLVGRTQTTGTILEGIDGSSVLINYHIDPKPGFLDHDFRCETYRVETTGEWLRRSRQGKCELSCLKQNGRLKSIYV